MLIHFIGIGGVSMSALAKYLFYNHFAISGSDKTQSFITDELNYLGIKVNIGHRKENCINADVAIYSSSIDITNPEFQYLKARGIPLIKRAELLNLIASRFKTRIGVSGSHGKTTTTSLLTHILYCANMPFTAHIGGYDRKFSNIVDNGNQIFLSEVCEFERNINKFTAEIAVVLNIDNDHLNCYLGISDLKNTFYSYLNRSKIPIINTEDKYLSKYNNLNALTFGINKGDYHISKLCNLGSDSKIIISEFGKDSYELTTKLPGEYNLYNILSSIVVSRSLKISWQNIAEGINSFSGIKRRNEYIGKINGAKVWADYCHHPKEINAFIKGLNLEYKRLFVVFQPHTYSRTKLLFNDFLKVFEQFDDVFIYKTYSARENYDYFGSAKLLSKNLPKSQYFDDFDNLISKLKSLVQEKDLILVLGAGDIYERFCEKIEI